MDLETILSVMVLAVIFLSLPTTIAWVFLRSRLEKIRADGHEWLESVLLYIAHGLGLPVIVIAAVCVLSMLLMTGNGPAWIWPFFFFSALAYFAIGWCVAWITVGIWFMLRSTFRAK